jgi:hypothetical protein
VLQERRMVAYASIKLGRALTLASQTSPGGLSVQYIVPHFVPHLYQ